MSKNNEVIKIKQSERELIDYVVSAETGEIVTEIYSGDSIYREKNDV